MQPNVRAKAFAITLLLVVLIFTTITILGKVLVPFLIALILSYIVNPLTEKIQAKFRVNRTIISFTIAIVTFIVFVAIPLFLLPLLLTQIRNIIHDIPDLLNLFNIKVLSKINSTYGTSLTFDYSDLKDFLMKNIGNVYNHVNIFSPIAHNGMILIEILVNIILIPFIMFYSIANFQTLLLYCNSFIPKRYTKVVHSITKDIDTLLAAYLRGQVSVMLIMVCYYSIGLNIVGLKSGTIIGIVTGLLAFIPYLGILSGIIISFIVAFTNFTGMGLIIGTSTVFVVGHLLEGGLITPYLVGGKIGLNPIMVIFALMVFGKLFGIVGILLALPLATIATVLLQHLKSYYLSSTYYSEE